MTDGESTEDENMTKDSEMEHATVNLFTIKRLAEALEGKLRDGTRIMLGDDGSVKGSIRFMMNALTETMHIRITLDGNRDKEMAVADATLEAMRMARGVEYAGDYNVADLWLVDEDPINGMSLRDIKKEADSEEEPVGSGEIPVIRSGGMALARAIAESEGAP